MRALSKMIEDADRKAQALISDILVLMRSDEVCTDEEFIRSLQQAYNRAEKKAKDAKTEVIRKDENRTRPKETPA